METERDSRLEYPDPTPVAMPVRFKKQDPMADRVRYEIAKHLSAMQEARGGETFEEANDFEVGDDYDPQSPWELTVDQELEHRDYVQQIIQSQREQELERTIRARENVSRTGGAPDSVQDPSGADQGSTGVAPPASTSGG